MERTNNQFTIAPILSHKTQKRTSVINFLFIYLFTLRALNAFQSSHSSNVPSKTSVTVARMESGVVSKQMQYHEPEQEAVKPVSGFESKTVREAMEWIREEETRSLRQLWLNGRMRQALCSFSGM